MGNKLTDNKVINNKLIRQLALKLNISDYYVDSEGENVELEVTRIAKILIAMGYSLESNDLSEAIDTLSSKNGQLGLSPTLVMRPKHESKLPIMLAENLADKIISWKVITEQGETLSGTSHLEPDLTSILSNYLDNQSFLFKLGEQIPLGYHRLEVEVGMFRYSCQLIQTPSISFQNEAISSGVKIWGSALQLYTLRSSDNWGMGDFSDLEQLVEFMSAEGAGFIGLNPLHALYPSNPEHASPYSPSNRNLINSLYIRPNVVAEFIASEEAQRWFNSDETQQKLEQIRKESNVNYSAVATLKSTAFDFMFNYFTSNVLGSGSEREKSFLNFVNEGGDSLYQHALFDSLLLHFHKLDSNAWGWPKWPVAFQDASSEQVKQFAEKNKAAIQYHQYLQFVAAEQLNIAHKKATDLNMPLGIYRDLAVGADRGGSEIWASPRSYCQEISVGAPPDALGPQGQNWGLPPFDPGELKQSGYQSFITLLKHNMQSCSALRIDHAMALFRLWWCPPGETAASGVYMHYPFEDLLGILLLESQRNKCLIIAEDLGTVPEEVKVSFPEAQLFSNKVFFYETTKKGNMKAPKKYSQKALAFVCSHDMPTLTGYWDNSDIDLRYQLGLLESDEVVLSQKQQRDIGKSAVLKSLKKQKLIEESDVESYLNQSMDLNLSQAIHTYVAKSATQLVSVQLEDMILVKDPVNIPGTSDEYPNWRRKLTMNTKDLFAMSEIHRFCDALNQARGK